MSKNFLLFVRTPACQSAMNSSLVNSLAKVYDPNPLHGQKPGGRKLSLNGSDKSQASSSPSSHHDAALRSVESRMDTLSSQMERLLSMQQTVLTRLDGLSLDVRGMGQDLASMREEDHGGRPCKELHRASERIDSQGRRLDGVEKLVEGTQQVISFIGEVVKSSRLVELLFKQPGNKSNKKKVRGLTTLQARSGLKQPENQICFHLAPVYFEEGALKCFHNGSPA